nr:MAG TPA: hypothetical protein [Caudoviricetes sp.]
MEQIKESTEKRMIKGVVIPTLTKGTAEEEKEKALHSLENRVFKQKADFESLKCNYRIIHNAVSGQQAELRAFKNRMHLAFAGLCMADVVFILMLVKMLIK